MPIATKSGGLIVKDGLLATNCNCCGVPVCSNFLCPDDDYETISNIVFRLTFSDFAYDRRFGILTSAGSACDEQYGTTGSFGITQPSFYNDYIDLANNFSADLFFEPSLTSPEVPFFWAGSGSATTPSGVTVTTYYFARYLCVSGGLQLIYTADQAGTTIPFYDPFYDSRQAESCSTGLSVVGPRISDGFGLSNPGSGKSFQCGNSNYPIREFYSDDALLFVSCGLATTSQGCFVYQDQNDANYYRIRLLGKHQLTAYENGLP